MITVDERDGTAALVNRAHFRELRLSSLRLTALCSFPLWVHAYVHPVAGAAVWLAVLASGTCAALAGVYGALERHCRRRLSQATAAAVVVARGWPALEPLRLGLLTATAVLTASPWLACLGCPVPAALHAAAGALATVVIGPALAFELLDVARALTRGATGMSHGGA